MLSDIYIFTHSTQFKADSQYFCGNNNVLVKYKMIPTLPQLGVAGSVLLRYEEKTTPSLIYTGMDRKLPSATHARILKTSTIPSHHRCIREKQINNTE